MACYSYLHVVRCKMKASLGFTDRPGTIKVATLSPRGRPRWPPSSLYVFLCTLLGTPLESYRGKPLFGFTIFTQNWNSGYVDLDGGL